MHRLFLSFILFRNAYLKDEIIEMIGTRKVGEECPEAPKARAQWNRSLTDEEWDITEQLRVLLQMPHAAVIEWQYDTQPTISRVVPMVEAMIKICETTIADVKTHPIIKSVARQLLNQLIERFSILDNPLYAIATLLDPTTKKYFKFLPKHVVEFAETFVQEKLEEPELEIVVRQPATKKARRSLMDRVFDTSSSPLPPPQDHSVFTIDAYLKTPFDEEEGVAAFLNQQPPAIKELYLSICGIPASSSEIERLFSTCGYINSKLRCSLKSENVEIRSLLKKNTAIVDIFLSNSINYPATTPKLCNWFRELPTYQYFKERAAAPAADESGNSYLTPLTS